MALLLNCKYCGKEFKTYPSQNKKFCGMACRNKSYVGKKASESTRTKMSISKRGYMPVNTFREGNLHPFWQKDRNKIQFVETPEYQEFRIRILKRDNYTCQQCGVRGKSGIRPVLHIHHIKPRKNYPALSLVESNVVVLCKECHKKTDSYLKRWEDFTGQKAELCGQ